MSNNPDVVVTKRLSRKARAMCSSIQSTFDKWDLFRIPADDWENQYHDENKYGRQRYQLVMVMSCSVTFFFFTMCVLLTGLTVNWEMALRLSIGLAFTFGLILGFCTCVLKEKYPVELKDPVYIKEKVTNIIRGTLHHVPNLLDALEQTGAPEDMRLADRIRQFMD